MMNNRIHTGHDVLFGTVTRFLGDTPMANNTPTLDSVKTQIVDLVKVMKSVQGFRVSEVIAEGLQSMARAIDSGEDGYAIKVGIETLKAGRNILGSFLRHSVVDRKMEGDQIREAKFNRELGIRREEEGYDPDIMERLESCRTELEKAVMVETSGTFAQRVALYNAMCKALWEADVAQEKRDKVRQEVARQKRLTRETIQGGTERRGQILAARRREADQILALI